MHWSDHAEVFYARIPHGRWGTGVRKRVEAVLAVLVERYPQCFVLLESKRRPLKAGIAAERCVRFVCASLASFVALNI